MTTQQNDTAALTDEQLEWVPAEHPARLIRSNEL